MTLGARPRGAGKGGGALGVGVGVESCKGVGAKRWT